MPKVQEKIPEDVLSRFWSKVKKTKTCWLWQGWTAGQKKYGQLSVKGEGVYAHRFSYIIHKGKISDGLQVLHKCDTPLCVNPDHLFVGTQKENMEDAVKKGRMAQGDNHYLRRSPELRILGEKHHQAKLTEEKVKQIRKLYKPYSRLYSVSKLAERFGVCHETIVRVLKAKTWRHV